MHVLRISPAIYRAGNWPVAFDPVGGLQTQVWRITEQLSRMGVEQTVLTGHIPGSPRTLEPFERTVVRCVGPWLPQAMGRWFGNFAWFAGALPELVMRARRYDLVHVHFNHSVWCRVLALLAAARGVPTVVSMNTALWGGLVDRLRLRGKPYDIAALIERRALSAARRVLALTEADASRKAQEMSLGRGHFVVVPDGIDLDEFAVVSDDEVSAFLSSHNIPAAARVITYVGRVSAEKGWEDLPGLLDATRDEGAFLLVCGDGPDRAKLEVLLRHLKRPGDWCITGFLSPEDVKLALRISSVLVLPSRREAFGGVLLEAMASDVPAVAYATGGIVEVAGNPPAVRLVEAGKTGDFVAAVGQVVGDPSLSAELIARGRSRVRDFSLDQVAATTLAVYRSVCGQAAERAATQLERDPP